MSKMKYDSMIGKRVRVFEDDRIRYGVITDCLSKEETAACMMYGHLIKAKMDDTGAEEEFLYGREIEDNV